MARSCRSADNDNRFGDFGWFDKLAAACNRAFAPKVAVGASVRQMAEAVELGESVAF